MKATKGERGVLATLRILVVLTHRISLGGLSLIRTEGSFLLLAPWSIHIESLPLRKPNMRGVLIDSLQRLRPPGLKALLSLGKIQYGTITAL